MYPLVWTAGTVILLALVEEVIKALIATSARGTGKEIESTLVFGLVEAVFVFPEVYTHYGLLGFEWPNAFLLSSVMLVGGKIFHVYTGIVYLKAKRVIWAVICMTVLHASMNYVVDLFPAFGGVGYTLVPWAMSSAAGLICLVYLAVERKLTPTRPGA